MNGTEAYAFLKERYALLANLDGASQILGKDEETVMASGSGADRVAQTVAIASACHTLIADAKVGDALDIAETAGLPPPDRRNLQLMRHRWVHEASLPDDLAQAAARVAAEGQPRHRQNYKSGDWATMRDWYAHSFSVMREVGQAKQALLGASSPYEAQVDQYSRGQKVAAIEREFSALDQALRRLIPAAIERGKSRPAPLPIEGPFPAEAQERLCRAVTENLGFDLSRGVLYFIHGHPSCGGSPDDSRLTARIDENDFLPALYATVHEAGHGIYEQNLPKDWRYQPIGRALGMDVHESQSMIMELQAAQTPEFLGYLSAQLMTAFTRSDHSAFSAANLQAKLWQAEPSFIRVEADELTYPMHILLRFDLEKKIFSGDLDPRDLPDAWGDGMQARLGIRPPNPSLGCMQDIHWPIGAQGYFPAYTLGAMGAAQLFQAASLARDDLRPALAQGNFRPLTQWLAAHVHQRGALVDPETLFIDATGASLNNKAYLRHLESRYLGDTAS